MINTVTTKEEMKELYDCSAMTWEGLQESDFELALELFGQDGANGYLIKGRLMNEICDLTGANAYPEDLNIFAIKDYKGLAFEHGARWFDDIVANNEEQEGRGYHYHDGYGILD